MKLQITNDQQEFFQNNHSILFENLLKEEEIIAFQQAVHHFFLKINSKDKFEMGRNLWKHPKVFEKLGFLKKLGEVLCQLQNQKILRIAYDQYYPPIDETKEFKSDKYKNFLKQTLTLQEMSSVSGLVGAVLITLSDPKNPDSQNMVLFLGPEGKIAWPDFAAKESYLMVYAQSTSFYLRSPHDPYSGTFIQAGYSSGDRLNDRNNPVIFKRHA